LYGSPSSTPGILPPTAGTLCLFKVVSSTPYNVLVAEILKSFIGSRISVWSGSAQAEHRDDGILRDADDQVVLIESGSEFLCFPVNRLRLIKIIERTTETDKLLRAYSGEELPST